MSGTTYPKTDVGGLAGSTTISFAEAMEVYEKTPVNVTLQTGCRKTSTLRLDASLAKKITERVAGNPAEQDYLRFRYALD